MSTFDDTNIHEMIHHLSEEQIREVRDFIGYLLEKDKKQKEFFKRLSEARKEPDIEFQSVDELMKTIREFEE